MAFQLFYKNHFDNIPKVGDRVKVAVGFSSYLNEGVVSSVHKPDDVGNGYCWINQYYPNGNLKNCFTASFSYCVFLHLKPIKLA